MPNTTRPRPDMDTYFMQIALAVRERANCLGNRVGAILVVENRIISTGYNGTPSKTKNCEEGGCDRCANRQKYGPGEAYDLCICVHAEQNTLLSAARFGVPVAGSTLYTTMRPCFGCTKELLQAGIQTVFYLHDWRHPEAAVAAQYEILQARFSGGIRPLVIDDPKADWAVSKKAAPTGAV